jgi:hypothetical protein
MSVDLVLRILSRKPRKSQAYSTPEEAHAQNKLERNESILYKPRNHIPTLERNATSHSLRAD